MCWGGNYRGWVRGREPVHALIKHADIPTLMLCGLVPVLNTILGGKTEEAKTGRGVGSRELHSHIWA